MPTSPCRDTSGTYRGVGVSEQALDRYEHLADSEGQRPVVLDGVDAHVSVPRYIGNLPRCRVRASDQLCWTESMPTSPCRDTSGTYRGVGVSQQALDRYEHLADSEGQRPVVLDGVDAHVSVPRYIGNLPRCRGQ
ncbi:hypothetical protein ACJJTC_007188 [Scirpophaga incertulas]